jgi:hypothetical protein
MGGQIANLSLVISGWSFSRVRRILTAMVSTQLSELIPALQVSISPVILISGVGLLLLSLTNRFGRAVDRSRQLLRESQEAAAPDRQRLAHQVDILFRRARLIQLAIILGATSALLAAVLIITLFWTALFQWELGRGISLLFIGCLACLIGCLVAFILDIRLSLHALRLELGHAQKVTGK